jgi:hypothetical protein
MHAPSQATLTQGGLLGSAGTLHARPHGFEALALLQGVHLEAASNVWPD